MTTFYERISEQVSDAPPNPREPRMAIAYYDRGKLLEAIGASEEEVGRDFEAALVLMPELPTEVPPIEQRDLKPWNSLLDLLSYDDPLIGASLRHPSAQLVVMQLSSELAATSNIATVEAVEKLARQTFSVTAAIMPIRGCNCG